MIVRKQDGQLLLIRQVDHSALAGEFTRHWGNDRFERPAPLEPIALASALHDDGWRELDEEVQYDAGRQGPLHWRDVEVARHVVFYRKGINRIAAMDPYAGVLASMHGAGIYARRYGTYPVKMSKLQEAERSVIETFISEQETLQSVLKRRLWNLEERRSLFERRLWTQYEWLQIWDRLSLFVCLNDLAKPAQDRLGPTPVAVDGPALDLVVRGTGGGVVTVAPYPFAAPAVEVSVPARLIPDRPYQSAEDLRAEVARALELSIGCRLVPAGSASGPS